MAKHRAVEKMGKATSSALLWILEIALKIAAPVSAAICLGSKGSFFEKVGAGFGSLPDTVRELIVTLGTSDYVVRVINDYNTLTAAAFNEKYGGGAISYVMQYLNEAVSYFQNVYDNMSSEPFSTAFATVLVFVVLYILSRFARFVRQQGQGSVIDKMERKAGDKIFRSESGQV